MLSIFITILSSKIDIEKHW